MGSLLSGLLAWPHSVQAQPVESRLQLEAGKTLIYAPGTSVKIAPEVLLQSLAGTNVVYLGETHDRPADHQAQLAILQALYRQRPNLVIAMEMFQRPFQPVLDRYLVGEITETALREQSQYDRRWGYDWEFYAPILRFAQAQKLPVIALNTPSEITRKVARAGLESLTVAEQQWIPPRSAIVLGPEPYRQRIRKLYDEIHQGMGNSKGFEQFFTAQVLWDETMAEGIAQSLQQQPDRLVVVMVGQGHLTYGDGIPNRVRRRLEQTGDRAPVQVSLLLNPAQDLGQDPTIADYFWVTEP
jgi:uncharacterized iron-regulated protein